eukprot:scaffold111849_cov66-Phaeocystis_antarctica.AAC.2
MLTRHQSAAGSVGAGGNLSSCKSTAPGSASSAELHAFLPALPREWRANSHTTMPHRVSRASNTSLGRQPLGSAGGCGGGGKGSPWMGHCGMGGGGGRRGGGSGGGGAGPGLVGGCSEWCRTMESNKRLNSLSASDCAAGGGGGDGADEMDMSAKRTISPQSSCSSPRLCA